MNIPIELADLPRIGGGFQMAMPERRGERITLTMVPEDERFVRTRPKKGESPAISTYQLGRVLLAIAA